MNPQGITVSSEKISPVKGMNSGRYAIPAIASCGIWKVVTRFSNTPQKTFIADFEVKEYVLPAFEVKLKPSKSFSYVRDESLTVDIDANSHQVRVEFMETEDVCSSASKKGKYRTIVNIDKDSSISVSYVIIPMTLGNHMIEVKASAYDSVHTDGVRKMLNVVGDAETEDGFTAVCVITMQEGKKICAESFGVSQFVSPQAVSVRKAVSFLEGRLPKQTDTLTVAFTSYAMASANKLNKDILMKHSTHGEDGRSWTATGQSYSSVHVTAFAMLALVKAKDFDKAREAVHWLKKQQDPKGGYGDPLGTIFVLWAMREYHMLMKDQQNLSLDVELSIAGRSKPVKYTFKNDNRHLTWSSKVDINKDFNVTARGTGTATLSVLTLYYTRLTEKKSDCTFFDLTVKMEKDPETKQGAIETYKLTMDFHYKSDKTDATMTILDIGLLTGFNVDATDLKELSTGKERYIQKFEMNKVLSERGSLILYLDKVLREYPQRISFRVHKMLNVGLLQPAAVTIYEYYSTDRRCTKFYHRERTDGALYKLCKGDLCYCAEENCSFQKKNQVSDVEHLNKACEAGMDYVYKVTVVGMDLQQTVDTYDMKVEQVLREGTDEEVEGKVRQFLARPRCREHLGLVKGKSYLIMGKSVDLPNHGGSLQYIFGEQTWVEYWPTRKESQTPEHRDRYIGISKLMNSLLTQGCAT
ncbi:complement C3-like protein [Labeo rohita]|uniref:Complement C3-like protein n=1 Tax=Labeo rohita TaxID=84645 RepID=A0A498L4T0_LABRO|nr:complement C3-like protein [Labeo rohita]